jgi:lipoprotein NlpI
MVTRGDWSWLICIMRILALASVGSLLSLPAGAQQSQNVEWCEGRGDPTLDQRIIACSELIQSSGELRETKARAYGNRGVAYDNKGDPEHARLDYDEAVRLDPTSAFAHRFQGNAYATKKGL